MIVGEFRKIRKNRLLPQVHDYLYTEVESFATPSSSSQKGEFFKRQVKIMLYVVVGAALRCAAPSLGE